jgi:hypothetical protein
VRLPVPSRGVAGLRSAYAIFLQRHPWQAFLTLTFDRRYWTPSHAISPERADKAFRQLVRYVNESLFGKRALRSTKHKGVIWARASEAHGDGVLHFHALLYSPTTSIDEGTVQVLREWWEHRFGAARAEVALSQAAVTEYLSKRLGADAQAEIDISKNFGWTGSL